MLKKTNLWESLPSDGCLKSEHHVSEASPHLAKMGNQ
jgi:hypothetical protein